MADASHADEVLRVYPSRTLDDAWWNPAYGDLMMPAGWESLPSGDAFVTRQVKRLGPHWVVVQARKGYTETLGLLAPAESIREAHRLAEATAARRKQARERSQKQRKAQEQEYQRHFTEAVLRFLDFVPRYAALAREIAEGAARQATAVGSGRVGRSGKLGLEEKAELAARAYIRHNHTRYEWRLLKEGLLLGRGGEEHRDVRREAHEEVDEFLEQHRRRGRVRLQRRTDGAC